MYVNVLSQELSSMILCALLLFSWGELVTIRSFWFVVIVGIGDAICYHWDFWRKPRRELVTGWADFS